MWLFTRKQICVKRTVHTSCGIRGALGYINLGDLWGYGHKVLYWYGIELCQSTKGQCND